MRFPAPAYKADFATAWRQACHLPNLGVARSSSGRAVLYLTCLRAKLDRILAAEAASGLKSFMDAKVVPSVAYTDPEIAWVGVTEDAAWAAGRMVEIGKFPWAASGRAIANGADYGLTKLVFDKETHRIIGGAIVGPSAGDMIGEICLAIEIGADAVDIGKTIHPHPTLVETIGMAAEAAEGVCTDLPSMTKKARRAS